MTQIPQWLHEALRCPRTGAELEQQTREGRPVLVAHPEGQPERVYEINNGVPVLLPERD